MLAINNHFVELSGFPSSTIEIKTKEKLWYMEIF